MSWTIYGLYAKINRYQKSYLDNIFHDNFVMNTVHLKPNQIEKGGVVMSTVDTCTTPEDGWGLVHHFLGNILLTVRLVVGDKEPDGNQLLPIERQNWFRILRKSRKECPTTDILKTARISGEICRMVKEYDLTDPANIDVIHAKISNTSRRLGR